MTVASGAAIAGGGFVSGAFSAQGGVNVLAGDGLAASDIGTLTFAGTEAMIFQVSIITPGLGPAAGNFFGITGAKPASTGAGGNQTSDGDLTVSAAGFAPAFGIPDWTGGMTSGFNGRSPAGSGSGLIPGNDGDSPGFDPPEGSGSG